MQRNLTRAAAQAGPRHEQARRIVHVSDLHFDGAPGRRAELDAELARVVALSPDLVLVTGDLTDSGAVGEFSAVADALSVLDGTPVVLVPGNRDVRGCATARPGAGREAKAARRSLRVVAAGEPSVGLSRDDSPMKFARLFGAANMTYTDDAMCVVAVNSNRKVPKRVLEAARSIFRDAPPSAVRILAAHHPVLPVPGKKLTDGDMPKNVGDLWELVVAEGVGLVATGHHHRSHVAQVGWEGLPPVTVSMSPMLTSATGRKHRGMHIIELPPSGEMTVRPVRTDAAVLAST